jgi:hypothetical protein|tara:strand:- start:666 stop:1325 length:660 start_codon:yes stop_codon:yes gene_type:complete
MTIGLGTVALIRAYVGLYLLDTDNVQFGTLLIDNAWWAAEQEYALKTGFQVKKGTAISVGSGVLTFDLPSDCLELKEITAVIDSEEKRLTLSTERKYDDRSKGWRTADGEVPREYALRPDLTIVLQAPTDQAYTQVYPYYVYRPDSSTIPNIPIEHHFKLMDFVLAEGFRQKMEWSTADRYQKKFDKWLKGLSNRSDQLLNEYMDVRDVRNLDYGGSNY